MQLKVVQGSVNISNAEVGRDEGHSSSIELAPSLLTAFIEKNKLWSAILEWLLRGTPDPSITHNRLQGEHHVGTGEWVLELEAFMRWLETPGSSLWIKGIRKSPLLRPC
jgi:hypothetical protein